MVAGTRSERFGCLAFALFPLSYLPFPFTFPSFALPSLLGGEGKGREKYYLNAGSLCYNSSASGWRNIIRNLRRFFQSSLMAREKDSKKEKEKKKSSFEYSSHNLQIGTRLSIQRGRVDAGLPHRRFPPRSLASFPLPERKRGKKEEKKNIWITLSPLQYVRTKKSRA